MHERMKWTTFFLLLSLITLSVSAKEASEKRDSWWHKLVEIYQLGSRVPIINLPLFSYTWSPEDHLQVTQEKKKKPFGLGKGPAYIGGSDIRYNGSELVSRIYKEYRNYRKMAKLSTPEQVAHDAKFADKGLCDLGCPRDTECIGGVCVCGKDKLQIYGQCWGTKYIAVSDAWNDVHRYRKPPDPKKPETCFRTVYEKDREGRRKQKKIIREEMLDVPACKTPPFIRAFDPSEQNCTFVKPCNDKDLNLQCNKDIDRCECRKGTTWNTRTMECQVYLDVDCTDVKDQTPNQDAIKQLRAKGENAAGLSAEEARIAFCFLLEEEAALYTLQQVKETDFQQ